MGSEDPPDATVVAADADAQALSDGLTAEARERADAAEEIMRRKMNGWIATYDSVMRPIATLVEDIDFNGLRRGACMELQRKAENANSQLKHAADEEIEILLRPAFEAFQMAGNACVVGDEVLWSVHLLQGKDHTHETQLLLDERYRYVGPYELEQEEALGHNRSLDTISGKYLAGELEETDIEAVPVN